METRFNHIGRMVGDAHWHLAAHRHSFHQLICVLRGRIGVKLEGRPYSARAGEYLLYPAGQAHEEWSETAQLETLYIGFEGAPVAPDAPLQGLDSRGRLRPLMEWLLEDRDARQPADAARRQTLLDAFQAELAGLLTRPGPGLVARTRAYVRAHLADPVRVEDLAQLAGLSKFHFIRAYTAQAGLTPMADVRALRLDAARHLILTTDLPLKSIAPEVGLASEYHLSRLLRTQFGVGVRQLRRT